MANMRDFKFDLGARVTIFISGEMGEIIGRSEFLNSIDQYLLRYKTADGRAIESWWAEDALVLG